MNANNNEALTQWQIGLTALLSLQSATDYTQIHVQNTAATSHRKSKTFMPIHLTSINRPTPNTLVYQFIDHKHKIIYTVKEHDNDASTEWKICPKAGLFNGSASDYIQMRASVTLKLSFFCISFPAPKRLAEKI